MFSYEEAKKRIPTQREKIVNILREAGEDGVTNAELAKVCLRYGARLQELYKQGYVIVMEHLNDGVYRYVLKKVPSSYVDFPNAEEEIMVAIKRRYDDSITTEELKALLEAKEFHIIRKPGWFKSRMDIH